MMTFSALAYASEDDIRSFLANPPQDSPAVGWQLAWGPVATIVTQGNLMYAVKNASTGQYGVVVRGTYPHFSLALLVDLFEDLDVEDLVPWRYPQTPNAQVARGTMDGLEELTNLQDSNSNLTLLQYLQKSVPSGAGIFVTGHSLGGCLSTVLAPWLRSQLGAASNVLPFTFAAPTAGNKAFAQMYTTMFPNGYRGYNVLDIIPMAWANLPGIKGLYGSPGPKCPSLLAAVIDLLEIKLGGLGYQQPNGNGSTLQGTPTATTDFFAEALAQHDHNYYLQLLGVPTIPFLVQSVKLTVSRRVTPVAASA